MAVKAVIGSVPVRDVGTFLKRTLWSDEQFVSCDPLTFSGIDDALHGRLLDEAEAAGFGFDGGACSGHGCEFDWDYDEASETLHVTCTKKPLLFSCNAVAAKISKLIEQAKRSI